MIFEQDETKTGTLIALEKRIGKCDLIVMYELIHQSVRFTWQSL